MIGELLFRLKSLRFIPALIMSSVSKSAGVIAYERDRWLACNNMQMKGTRGFLCLMMKFPEFRSLVYYRTGCGWLRHFGRGQSNLYFHTPSEKIGKGLIIWHGYSTVINAESVGNDCSIWHNVTIGKKSVMPIEDRPTIGSNVSICTGAVVIGKIDIADDVVIGAGSTVVDSVPAKGSVVAGIKAKVISNVKR